MSNGGSRSHPAARALLMASLVGVACAQASCASISYVDARGARHVVGLVAMTLPPGPADGNAAVDLTTFGVSLRTSGDGETQATLGYSHDLVLSVAANTCVDLKTPGPCRDLAAGGRGRENVLKGP